MFKRLLFKLYLFHKGIRFYKTESTPRVPQFRTAVFQTVGNSQVEFHFYKEVCEDLIFKHGAIRSEKFIGYVIQAKLSNVLPEKLAAYNNLKFFFNTKNLILKDEDTICDTLLNIYLDFLRKELKSPI
jgi:hypothetical protein